MIQLIPTLIVAPLFIQQRAEFGEIGQSAVAFSTLVGAFSLIITQFQSISSYASVLTRLGEFVEATDRVAARDLQPGHIRPRIEVADDVSFQDVTLQSGDQEGRNLVEHVNVTIPRGQRVFITGTNDAAKQFLFRATAELDSVGSGRIMRPVADKTAFLPKYPFVPSGTLREVMVTGGHDEEVSDAQIRAVLQEVGLEKVAAKEAGDEAFHNWHERLPVADQQLMAVARALLSEPAYAFVDHLGSTLTPQMEKRVLSLMAERGITCISFGDGAPDPTLYDSCLELKDDASWAWTDLTSAGSSQDQPHFPSA